MISEFLLGRRNVSDTISEFFVGAETNKIQFQIFLQLPNHIRYNFNFFEPKHIRYNFRVFLLVPTDKERVDEPKEDLLITILAQNQVK